MKNHLISVALVLVISGCGSTPAEIKYFEQNYEAMSSYNSLHGKELGLLTEKINNECVFKRMDKKNLSLSDLVSIPLNGTVIYDLTNEGIVSSALYISKDTASVKRRKQKCIESVALGYQLPPPNELEKVYSRFNVNIES